MVAGRLRWWGCDEKLGGCLEDSDCGWSILGRQGSGRDGPGALSAHVPTGHRRARFGRTVLPPHPAGFGLRECGSCTIGRFLLLFPTALHQLCVSLRYLGQVKGPTGPELMGLIAQSHGPPFLAAIARVLCCGFPLAGILTL